MQSSTNRVTIELRRLLRDSHGQCSVCQKPFSQGDTIFLGYDNTGQAECVGDCCSHLMADVVQRYSHIPRGYVVPPPDAVLWRYMDLGKFIALLKDRALFFARADRLGDPFEGAKGIVKRKAIWDEHYLDFFRVMMRNPPEGVTWDKDEAKVEADAQRLLQEIEQGGRFDLQRTFISCWHESRYESEALWRLYGGNDGRAVAIKTEFARLNKSLGDDPSIKIGRVQYLDFSKDFAGINEAYFRKRLSFAHEREVRAIVHIHHEPPEFGVNMPVNLEQLIDKVCVSPLAPAWFEEVVAEVLSRFGLECPLTQSELNEEAFY